MKKSLLKTLYQCSNNGDVDVDHFLSICPDTQELRNVLLELSAANYIVVAYASGEIYDISITDTGLSHL